MNKVYSEMTQDELITEIKLQQTKIQTLTVAIAEQGLLGEEQVNEIDAILTDQAATLAGDFAGEIASIVGGKELGSKIDELVTNAGSIIGKLIARYSPISIASLLGGDNDGQAGWYKFELKSQDYDNDLKTLDMPAGVYIEGAGNKPGPYDGAYGRHANGAVAATAYEVWWRPNGGDWTKDLPAGILVDNPKDTSLKEGVYVFSFGAGDDKVPSREDFNGAFKSSKRTHGILHITPSGERRVYHGYFGCRAWVLKGA